MIWILISCFFFSDRYTCVITWWLLAFIEIGISPEVWGLIWNTRNETCSLLHHSQDFLQVSRRQEVISWFQADKRQNTDRTQSEKWDSITQTHLNLSCCLVKQSRSSSTKLSPLSSSIHSRARCSLFIHSNFFSSTTAPDLFTPVREKCRHSSSSVKSSCSNFGFQPSRATKFTSASGRKPRSYKDEW